LRCADCMHAAKHIAPARVATNPCSTSWTNVCHTTGETLVLLEEIQVYRHQRTSCDERCTLDDVD
jgi:hypothetical protein